MLKRKRERDRESRTPQGRDVQTAYQLRLRSSEDSEKTGDVTRHTHTQIVREVLLSEEDQAVEICGAS